MSTKRKTGLKKEITPQALPVVYVDLNCGLVYSGLSAFTQFKADLSTAVTQTSHAEFLSLFF